jgi:phage-related protein
MSIQKSNQKPKRVHLNLFLALFLKKTGKSFSLSKLFPIFAPSNIHITMELQKKFNVILHSEAQEFLASLDEKTRNKIFQTFDRASLLLDPELFKKLADTDIWEFRTLFNKKKYRVLAFWDKEGPVDTLVIATHGFIKKTQKTPQKEINKAQSIRELYFKNKQNNKKDE